MDTQTKTAPGGKPFTAMLGEVAVIAAVQASSLGLTRLDKKASVESDVAHGAKVGTGKTHVVRLPGAEAMIDAIKSKQTLARSIVKGYTTQWGVDRRLLPNVNIEPCLGAVYDVQIEHDKLVQTFVDDAQAYITNAYRHLGDYSVAPPTIAEIEKAFSLEVDLSPVPNTNAFTCGDKALEAQLRKRFEDDLQAAYDAAEKDAISRLAEPLGKLVERMEAYDDRRDKIASGELLAKESKTGTFKQTIISNITDIGKVFRTFNLRGDPALEKVAAALEDFTDLEHKDLVKDKTLRRETAAKAQAILDTLGDWL